MLFLKKMLLCLFPLCLNATGLFIQQRTPCTLNHIKQTVGHEHGPQSDHVHCNNIMAKCPENTSVRSY